MPKEEYHQLLPHIFRLSNILEECVPKAWEARRFLYCTIFVEVASRKGTTQQILDELEQNWKPTPQRLYQLLLGLVNLDITSNDEAWSQVRTDLLSFYNDTTGSRNAITRVPKSFRPLPSVYHAVRTELRKMREDISQREDTSTLLQKELQEFAKRNEHSQCPVPRKYVTLRKTADPDPIWNVKIQAFADIFQRTRELFQFQDEDAHFYHAAAIIDFMHKRAQKKHIQDNRHDKVALERQAAMLEDFRRVYIDLLEKIQMNLQIDQMVKLVSKNGQNMSKRFTSVRNVAQKGFEKHRKLLGEDDYVLPVLSSGKASLASALYRMLQERRVLYDDLARITDKLSKQLHQLQAWEELTRKKIFGEIVSRSNTVEPGAVQVDDYEGDVIEPNLV